MHRIIRLAMAGAILAVTVGAVACKDGGDSLTLEEYFAKVDAVDTSTDASITALFDAITDEGDVGQYRTAMKELGPLLDKAGDDLDKLDPPKEAEDEHDALVVSLHEWADASTEAANAKTVADADTPEVLFAAFDEAGFGEAEAAFSTKCKALQQVAADNGINVDLNCDDEEDEAAAAEQRVRDIAEAWNAKDTEQFASYFTETGLNAAFGDPEAPASREEVLAQLEDAIGQGAIEIKEITQEATDAGADVTVLWISGNVLENMRFSLLLQDGEWKVEQVEDLGPVAAPAGYATVNVDMKEFSFTFDPSAITSNATFALQANNAGTQEHHLIFMKIPADASVEELLAADDPAGVESVAGMAPIAPGEHSTIVVAKPLEPGRYLFACFVPDATQPDGPPHAMLGMTADFTVE